MSAEPPKLSTAQLPALIADVVNRDLGGAARRELAETRRQAALLRVGDEVDHDRQLGAAHSASIERMIWP